MIRLRRTPADQGVRSLVRSLRERGCYSRWTPPLSCRAVGFDVIPAIDVMGGRLVRMQKGDPMSLRLFSGDPVALAARFVELGARWLHFVDLDAAFSGEAANRALLERVAELPVRVQAGGGLSPQEAERALEAGVARAVIGAQALADRPAVERALVTMGERAAVALDVRGGRIVPRGSGTPGPPLDLTLRWLDEAGCPRLIYTDVDRDGALAGPDMEALRRLGSRTRAAVVASGGIASLEHIEAVAALGPPLEAVIVGRAFYETDLDIARALALSRAP